MIGEKIGPFRIEEKIGAGAMGVVYRALYEPTGQAVALKVISAETAQRNNAAERFERESDILKQFRHPNIVLHIGTGFSRTRNLRYYAMEYVPGETLDGVLASKGPLPWPEVVELGIQTCDALQYAHERGVVHRDLKPSNLMIDQKGTLKLTDFGIAKDLDRTALTADGRTLGTAAYMAPEQIRGAPAVSHKTDLYALGCVLYQMLTGRAPYAGSSALQLMHKHLDEPPPKASAANPDVPKALDRLIQTLMAKSPDDRPWDAQAVAQQLRELKERHAQGMTVPMAYSDVPANPSRAGEPLAAASTGATGGAAASTRTRRSRATRERAPGDPTDLPALRSRIETALLVLGLVAITGFIAYQLWPPSADYLFGKAGEYMASEARADRLYARETYMAELDRRHPDHPYKEALRGWRDALLLEDAERKATFLENPSALAASKPEGPLQSAYVASYRAAAKAVEEGRDRDAVGEWSRLAELLERSTQASGEESDRMWYVLARKRASDLGKEVDIRVRSAKELADSVLRLLATARLSNQPPPVAEVARACGEIVTRFQGFQSTQEFVGMARAQLQALEAEPAAVDAAAADPGPATAPESGPDPGP